MGLTAEVELSLRDAGLTDFYIHHIGVFRAHAERAYEFAYNNVNPTGLRLRKDDVATSLVSALLITEELRDYLAQKSLRQRFWYQRFADLILDRLWEDLESAHAQA